MAIEIEDLGMTQEELRERVISATVSELLEGMVKELDLATALNKRLKEEVERGIDTLARTKVLPDVLGYLGGLKLQKTNQWGEPKSEPLSLIEYMTEAAEKFMTEKVDFNGKAKRESDYRWNESSTRIVWLVKNHFQTEIKAIMDQALRDANQRIVGGIQDAVKIALNEISQKLKVEIK